MSVELKEAPAPADDPHALFACEVYQAWQAAHEEAGEAFLAWCAAAYGQKAEAHAVYRAAADREDVAAERWLVI